MAGRSQKNGERRSSASNGEVKDEDTSSTEIDLRHSFWLTRIVFLRGLAFVYFVAFAISYFQNKELIGNNGLTPAKLHLSRIKKNQESPTTNIQLFMQLPTLYWFIQDISAFMVFSKCFFFQLHFRMSKTFAFFQPFVSWDNFDSILDMTALLGMSLSFVVFIKGNILCFETFVYIQISGGPNSKQLLKRRENSKILT